MTWPVDGYGTDLTALPDLNFGTTTGPENLRHAILRRLTTPRGGLITDETYGLDVRAWQNEGMTEEQQFELVTLVAAECEKDPRVLSAVATWTTGDSTSGLLKVTLTTTDCPVPLTLPVSAVTLEVLNANP
ncbi:MAG TPA: hypothetical protein VHN99_05465 [Deinococcales bacterium]|nr:hypothetical protein [Deinococcales bacterium]